MIQTFHLTTEVMNEVPVLASMAEEMNRLVPDKWQHTFVLFRTHWNNPSSRPVLELLTPAAHMAFAYLMSYMPDVHAVLQFVHAEVFRALPASDADVRGWEAAPRRGDFQYHGWIGLPNGEEPHIILERVDLDLDEKNTERIAYIAASFDVDRQLVIPTGSPFFKG